MYFARCGFCRERFTTNVMRARDLTFVDHVCADMRTDYAKRVATIPSKLSMLAPGVNRAEAEQGMLAKAVSDSMAFAVTVKALVFKPKANPTKCGPRCWGAKAEQCDCECGGHNHGIGKAPTL